MSSDLLPRILLDSSKSKIDDALSQSIMNTNRDVLREHGVQVNDCVRARPAR